MANDPTLPGDRGIDAAEYALGLLSGGERAAADARMTEDRAFAAEVDTWQSRFAAFYGEIAPVVPDRDLWPSIAARIPVPAAANDRGPSVLPWKIATGLFGSIAAALALVLVTRPLPPPPAPPTPPIVQPARDVLVAQLATDGGVSMLAAKLDAADGMRVRATAIPQGSGQPELWVIPEGGAPVSVGQIARTGVFSVVLTDEQRRLIRDGATLALTLEPADGAPHKAPTGDILGTARITRI